MKLAIAPQLARAGMTQTALADRVGVNKGFMSEVVSGKKYPSVETLMAIAAALGVPVVALFDDAPTDQGAARAEPAGMAEDATPYTPAATTHGDPVRTLYASRARNAAITHRAAVDMPGFGITAGDLLVCDLSRLPSPGEVTVAVAVDTDTGTAQTMIRRYTPPFLLAGAALAATTIAIETSGIDIRHPVIGIIRGT